MHSLLINLLQGIPKCSTSSAVSCLFSFFAAFSHCSVVTAAAVEESIAQSPVEEGADAEWEGGEEGNSFRFHCMTLLFLLLLLLLPDCRVDSDSQYLTQKLAALAKCPTRVHLNAFPMSAKPEGVN